MTEFFSLSLASGTPAYPNQGEDHDLYLDENGALAVCTNAEAVAQRVRQHLELYQGEWFLNTEAGTPWYEFIYVEPFNQPLAESVLKIAILEVPGVIEILEFDVNVDFTERSFRLNKVVIKTEFDEKVSI